MNIDTNKLSRIEKLERQAAILKNRLQKEKSKHKEQTRKDETRMKILLGAWILDKLRKDGNFDSIKTELDSFLTRDKDRALFNLPLRENKEQKSAP